MSSAAISNVSADESNSSILSLIHNLLLEEQSNNGGGQQQTGINGSHDLFGSNDFAALPQQRHPSAGNGGHFGRDDDNGSSCTSSSNNYGFSLAQGGLGHGGRQADAFDIFGPRCSSSASNVNFSQMFSSPSSSSTSNSACDNSSKEFPSLSCSTLANNSAQQQQAVRGHADRVNLSETNLATSAASHLLSSNSISSIFSNGLGLGQIGGHQQQQPQQQNMFDSMPRMSSFPPIGSSSSSNDEQHQHVKPRFFSGDNRPYTSNNSTNSTSINTTTGTNQVNQLQHQYQLNHLQNHEFGARTFQMEKFESHIRMIANEINSTIQQHMNGLQTRKEQLLQQLDTIRKIYVEILKTRNILKNGNGNGNGLLMDCDDSSSLPSPCITFTKPDLALQKAVSSLGFLTAPAFAPYCMASGEGLEVVVPGINTSFTVQTKNCFNDDLLIGRENLFVSVIAICNSASEATSQPSLSAAASSSQFLRDGSQSPFSNFNSTGSTGNSMGAIGSGIGSGIGSNKTIINHSILDHNNGKYTVTYLVPVLRNQADRLQVSVMVNGLAIAGSPFRISVQSAQRGQTWRKLLTFGNEGNAIGQFCRPWGVAIAKMSGDMKSRCDSVGDAFNKVDSNGQTSLVTPLVHLVVPTSSSAPPVQLKPQLSPPIDSNGTSNGTSIETCYLIAVADRSNNRVQLFKYHLASNTLTTVNVFGSGPGTRQGQFDRPAGICFNMILGHVIVADKDNHRIQIFDLNGRYLFKFGEKGNRVGQFCYPWDVDSCPTSQQILVSDTRNRRVQLFTSYGQYITHFAQPLDSPRGVAFLGDKKLVVSDFNKHRLLIFDKFSRDEHMNNGGGGSSSSSSVSSASPPNGQANRSVGFGEGNGWGEFLRPQGVSVCGSMVVCADSRNNRICLYNLLTQVFEYLTDDLALDRPSGLAIADNLMVVVDFGNNRLHICHR